MTEEKKKENISKEQSVQNLSQSQSNTIRTQQSANNVQQLQMRYSGFWVRGAAHIIDGIVVGIISIIIIFPLGFIMGFVSSMSDSAFVNAVTQGFATIIGLMIAWGYFIFMTHKFQATLGKMAVGAIVVDENGKHLSLGKITLRETIGKMISGLLLGIGYLMIAFTSKKQGLHDIISNSVVIYKDAQKGANGVVVTIVYILYGLLMAIILAIFVFIVMIAGLAIFSGAGNNDNPFNWNSFIENIDNEMTDDGYLDDEGFNEMPFDMKGLEQIEDEVKDNI